MKTFRIQYDYTKNTLNQLKHRGVSLADAEPVFHDAKALMIEDRDHDEERWVVVGKDAKDRILVVAYTYRDPNFVRIIGTRLASKSERRQYLEV